MTQQCVIETGEKWNDGQIIQKGKIPADDEKDLEQNQQSTGDVTRGSRSERKPGYDQLSEMVPKRFEFMKRLRRKMQIAADRAWDWLSFVVVKHAGQVAPAFVATNFDQAGADHDPKTEPAKKPEHQNRRPAFRKWATVE